MSKQSWRVVQFFVSADGVDTVEILGKYEDVRCTCNTFEVKENCKHIRYIEKATAANQGEYPITLEYATPDARKYVNSKDPENHRRVIAEYGKVVLL